MILDEVRLKEIAKIQVDSSDLFRIDYRNRITISIVDSREEWMRGGTNSVTFPTGMITEITNQ